MMETDTFCTADYNKKVENSLGLLKGKTSVV